MNVIVQECKNIQENKELDFVEVKVDCGQRRSMVNTLWTLSDERKHAHLIFITVIYFMSGMEIKE